MLFVVTFVEDEGWRLTVAADTGIGSDLSPPDSAIPGTGHPPIIIVFFYSDQVNKSRDTNLIFGNEKSCQNPTMTKDKNQLLTKIGIRSYAPNRQMWKRTFQCLFHSYFINHLHIWFNHAF